MLLFRFTLLMKSGYHVFFLIGLVAEYLRRWIWGQSVMKGIGNEGPAFARKAGPSFDNSSLEQEEAIFSKYSEINQ